MRDLWKYLLTIILSIVLSWLLFGQPLGKDIYRLTMTKAHSIHKHIVYDMQLQEAHRQIDEIVTINSMEKVVFPGTFGCYREINYALGGEILPVGYAMRDTAYTILGRHISPYHAAYKVQIDKVICWVVYPYGLND